jgi:uroporphyrin-III C-methyltransferase/precorrin-2 dehydrogenase/sirohydrochlorin ferrochelatase
MGVGRVAVLADDLAGAGFPPDTPFAIVENGSRPEQRILRGTLSGLPRIAEEYAVHSPAILFVGRTAALLPYENTGETSDEHVAQGG